MAKEPLTRAQVFLHAAVPTSDLERSRSFYENILGLQLVAKPPTKSKEVRSFTWYQVGGAQIHLMQRLPDLDKRLGIDQNPSLEPHFALEVEDMEATKRALQANGIEYLDWTPYGITTAKQIFVRDPDGNMIEIEERMESA